MDEASKTRKIWGPLETTLLQGKGIDIGCGPDPVTPDVRRFDRADGDANHITRHVRDQFDFVYSSHCLEHMRDPRCALHEWWQLVRPGGHLIFIVPDEDLYEQGVFPSRFNPDHKATFTISKARSWSPASHNVLDLARGLPDAELVSLVLHDHGYDRSMLRHQSSTAVARALGLPFRVYNGLRRRGLPRLAPIDRWQSRHAAVDQTIFPNVLAQIQCILRKFPRT
ncbi:MAG: class I SAM-dependent methyltransferase [Opitutus sp.]|nr:class I SAM-dependent methyltransferase [Opitutus sp.]